MDPAAWDEADVHNALVTLVILSNFLPGGRRFQRLMRFVVGLLLGWNVGRFLTRSRWTKDGVSEWYSKSNLSPRPYVQAMDDSLKEGAEELQR